MADSNKLLTENENYKRFIDSLKLVQVALVKNDEKGYNLAVNSVLNFGEKYIREINNKIDNWKVWRAQIIKLNNEMEELYSNFYSSSHRNLLAKGSVQEHRSNSHIQDFVGVYEDLINIRMDATDSGNVLSIPQPEAIIVILEAWNETLTNLEDVFKIFIAAIIVEVESNYNVNYLSARGRWLTNNNYYNSKITEMEKNQSNLINSKIIRKGDIFVPHIKYGVDVILRVIDSETRFNKNKLDELKSFRRHVNRFKY